MDGVLIALIVIFIFTLLLTIYIGLCLYDLLVICRNPNKRTFISNYNLFEIIFKTRPGSSSVIDRAVYIKKSVLALKVTAIATAIAIILNLLSGISLILYQKYLDQLTTATTVSQWLMLRQQQKELEEASREKVESVLPQENITATSLFNTDEGDNSNQVSLQGNGTITMKFCEMLQQSYIDAKVTGSTAPGFVSYSQKNITLTFDGKQFRARPDCTGLLNSVVKMMGYWPPGTKERELMSNEFINSSSWCAASNYIEDADGSESADWKRLDYNKDDVQPGDILVRPPHGNKSGHGEMAVGWDGNELYGFNYGWNDKIEYTQEACRLILEEGMEPLEACKKAGSVLSPNTDWGGSVKGYKYIYRYVGTGAGLLSNPSVSGGYTTLSGGDASGWVNSRQAVKGATLKDGSGATVVVAVQFAKIVHEQAGVESYSQSKNYTFKIGDEKIVTREDCSGYMSVIMYLLDLNIAPGANTSIMAAYTPHHKDGTAATDWEKVNIGYDWHNCQAGDIVVTNGKGHTEMFYSASGGTKYGFNYGDTKPIQRTNAAAVDIVDGMDIDEALHKNNCSVGIKNMKWAFRYTGSGKGTLADKLGLLDGAAVSANTPNNAIPDNSNVQNSANTQGVNAFSEPAKDWVDSKDMFRHGGVLKDPTDSYTVSAASETVNWQEYKPGMANGEYALEVGGGKYYWYHQTAVSDSCKYCGDWTSMPYGNLSDSKVVTLGVNGSPIYAAAILVSNLTNSDQTPIEILGKLGVTIAGDHSSADTSTSNYIDGVKLKDETEFINKIVKDSYSLTLTDNLASLSESEAKTKVDETLKSGGLVIMKVNGDHIDGSWWPDNVVRNHYLVIYKSDESGYYILDQLSSNKERMEKAIDFSAIYQCLDGFMYGSVNPNPPMIKTTSSFTSSGTWYGDASKIGKATGKEDLGDGFYLYNGLPWEPDKDTYTVDTTLMLDDMIKYVNSLSNGTKATDVSGKEVTADYIINEKYGSAVESTRMFASGNTIPTDLFKQANLKRGYGGAYGITDGIQCIAVGCPPAVLDRYYCVDFGSYNETGAPDGGPINYWSQRSTAYVGKGRKPYDYGNKKIALILRNKDDSSTWYLPVTEFDAKAHTFPGGVCQTGWTLARTYTKDNPCDLDSSGNPTKFNCHVCNSGGDFGMSASGSMSELVTQMNKKNQTYNNSFTAWETVWNVVEPWEVPTSVKNKIIKSHKYVCIGYVVWDK